MGDLQSPTYVKRTAHMFNSIYSSQNGSPPVVDHNPSYLNVSKSVSGYSCLSYNGNTNGSTTTTVTNGSSAPKNRISSNGASSAPASSTPYSHRFVQNGAGKPVTASSNRSEFRIKVNQNQDQVRSGSPNSRDLALSPTRKGSKLLTKDIDEDVADSNYVPSHGKSFIMQRIERLYGSDAHTVTASTGIATRKTVNQSGVGGTVTTIKFETVHHHQPSRGKETIIPIQLEKENRPEVDSSTKTCIQSSIVSKDREEISQVSSFAGYERCFRGDEILIRDQNDDDTHTNIIKQEESNESELSSDMKSILNHKSFGGLGSVTSLEPCPGKHKLETITLDEKDKHLLISGSDSNCKANGDQPLLAQLEENTGSSSSSNSIISTNKQPVPLTKTKVSMADLKDGNYFLQEMRNTVTELQRLCDKASPELETLDQQSDRAGNILAAVGKSNLLIKKKFKQFEELCNANLRGVTSDEPATTNDDLAGFWDMVMIQVEQVFNLFKDIEENNSGDTLDVKPKTTSSPKKTTASKGLTKPTASKSQISAAAKARDESRRKMLAERRRQLKEQDEGTKAQEDVVIFTPENN